MIHMVHEGAKYFKNNTQIVYYNYWTTNLNPPISRHRVLVCIVYRSMCLRTSVCGYPGCTRCASVWATWSCHRWRSPTDAWWAVCSTTATSTSWTVTSTSLCGESYVQNKDSANTNFNNGSKFFDLIIETSCYKTINNSGTLCKILNYVRKKYIF